MNLSSAPIRKLEKFTSFTAEIDLGRPISGTVKEYPRFFYAESGVVMVKQDGGAEIDLPEALLQGGFPHSGVLSILPAASGTSATAVWVGW